MSCFCSVAPPNNVAQLPGLLKSKIGQIPQTCLAAFGTGRSALSGTGGRIKFFYNGVTDKGNLYMFYKPGQYALSQYSFQAWNATTTANATTLLGSNGLPSPNVVVWSNFWAQGTAAMGQTLWHELTHVFTQQGDLDLDQRFNINTGPFGGPNYGASAAYDAWLANGCH